MVPNINGLDSSGHADLGASFLSLISGPSAHMPCDLQQSLHLKSVPISHQVSLNHGTANGFSAGSRVSVLPGALRQHNMGSHSLISGEIFFPFMSSKSTANCRNSSALLHAPNLNFQKSQAVASQNAREQDKLKSFSSLIGSHNAGPISANRLRLQEYADIAALQDIPVENNFTSCHHGHHPSSSFPRVFCSGISGNLLLSDTGLLGVVCTCHGLYMSISKFSEHSGSSDVNPGNAVRMDNGETVAHWWKTSFSQSGIRVLEGQRGWDWPEGISATSGVTNCPVSNLSNNTVLLNQVGPFRPSVSYEQQHHSIMNAKENRSCRSVVDEYAYHEKDRISQECSNSLFKCFCNSSNGLHHAADQKICGLRNSSSINTEKASQSTTVKLDPICESSNSLHALPNIQDLKKSFNGFSVGRNTSLIVEGPRVSPQIGLRLGQLPEQSQALETKVLNAYGSSLNGMHTEPSKVFSSDRLPLKTGNELQGSKWTLDFADIGFSPSELEGSSNVEGPYGAVSDYQKDSYNGNLEMADHNPLLLSCFMNPGEKWQFKNTYVNGSDSHVVGEKLHYQSHASRSEKVCFPWSRVASSIKDFDTNVSNTQNHMSKGEEMECAVNGLLGTAKSSTESSKRLKEDMKTFNVVVDESSSSYSPAFHEKSPKLHQMSPMIVDESHGRDILYDGWKISSYYDIRQFNHDHVKPIQNSINSKETASMGCKTSFFVESATPTLSTKKCNGINPSLQDHNMKMPAVRNMLGLSDGDNGSVSVRNIQYSEILRKPCVQSLLTITPSMSKDHVHLLDSSRMEKIPEVGEKLTLPGSICWTGHNSEPFGTMTGRSFYTEDCDLPPVERLFLRPGCIEDNLTHSKKEQFSQALPYACVPKNYSCTVQANCLTGKYDLNGDACCTLTKKGDRAGAATSLFNSNLNDNCIFPEKGAKTPEKTENFVAPKLKRVKSHSFQWRDVPRKITESCSSTSKEQEAGSFNTSLVRPAAGGAKCFTGFAQNVVPLKEHEISNISSGCSAPDMTQLSIEVNKKDSCMVEGRDIKCANNVGLDEGSGNDRIWSSDDALDDENRAEFFDSPSTSNLIKSGPLKVVQRKPSLGLIEEIRLQNSLRSENASNQIKRSSTIQEESGLLQKFDVRSKKRRKTVKWRKFDAPICVSGQSSLNYESPKCSEEVGQNAHSFWNMPMPVGCDQVSSGDFSDCIEQSFQQRKSAFLAAKGTSIESGLHKVYHQAEQQTIEAHKSSSICDPLKTTDVFRKKRLRSDDSSSKKIRDICCNSALTAKLTLSGCPSNSLIETNFCKWMARPTVFGKYGIISNGNPSKPTKIVPLRKIFKIAASHAGKSNKGATSIYHHDKLKSASVKMKMTSVRHAKEMSLSEKVLKGEVRKGGTNALQPIELEPCHLNADIETASCSATNGNDDLSYTSKKSNIYGITEGIPGYDLKRKFKEGRKRSLSELLVKGNGFKIVNSSVMKNSRSVCKITGRCFEELMEDDAGDTVQTNQMNNCTRYSEKRQPKSSDMFSCVCGNSDRHESDQLLECNRFLIKGLRIKAEAANNEDISFKGRCMLHASSSMFIPDSGGESLQLGEKFTCARTEGYKGRKREGFLHNHPQDANGNAGCLVPQEQLNAWLHIHRQKPQRKACPKLSSSIVGSDCRKAYALYKQAKGWKNLVVYKSGIHALGLYTSQFISRGAMVVEYVGEIVGLRVADRRESEYHSGKKLQHKSACYFFRIDKEHIIDATRKGGIARFVNHSCQPNCVAKVISVRNEKKVVFFAEREIYPGEEITYDYHFNHEDEGDRIPCYCKSKNCRRYLN
ncbi:Histone-lysine N-methyltransferase trr [Sesamum alatum]|uniref:Histone-lysine N-methyltransferase trr n=1 Tax=Sesamum alatum TaxID=300844 RepID=A0AAE1XQ25_9LAMI|nr:Histone-lysine N-methyltransferase trr [Sesamum alatum]